MNSTWIQMAEGLCPRCRKGKMFISWMKVYERCPACGLLLQRESGYFLGALYIEYGIAGAALALITYLLRVWTTFGIEMSVLIALLIFAPFVPITVRYSRILWLYWDYAVDPPQA